MYLYDKILKDDIDINVDCLKHWEHIYLLKTPIKDTYQIFNFKLLKILAKKFPQGCMQNIVETTKLSIKESNFFSIQVIKHKNK